ncbi:MAG: hypothetical protein HQL67_10535, partial [Magnetococcales bacterium]|nr:hypothetical protein [Magnetococcales bacterium]
APSPEEKKSSTTILIVFLLVLCAGFVVTFLYLDKKVEVQVKKLDQSWADKQESLRSMARQRMYDSRQSNLQTEMMDRLRPTGKGDVSGLTPEKP